MQKTNAETPPKKHTLTEKVTEALRTEIQEGAFQPGMKLPTEPVLIKKFGVSRTVIRESIAVLKAEGLLEPRQGAGVYVLSPPPSLPNRSFLNVENAKISDCLEILELRIAVEVEAVDLACRRCTMAHQAKIYETMQEMIRVVEKNGNGIEADYNFHRAIAKATNNSKYVEFLDSLGNKSIPRSQLKQEIMENPSVYLKQIVDEHQAIYQAISQRDSQNAKQAMRAHLSGSLQRYQSLIQGNFS